MLLMKLNLIIVENIKKKKEKERKKKGVYLNIDQRLLI